MAFSTSIIRKNLHRYLNLFGPRYKSYCLVFSYLLDLGVNELLIFQFSQLKDGNQKNNSVEILL